MPRRGIHPSGCCSLLLTDGTLHGGAPAADPPAVTARERLRFPVVDLASSPDPDLVALWIFALLGERQEDLLFEYLDLWPSDYRAVAQA